jgi:hypothetical protein
MKAGSCSTFERLLLPKRRASCQTRTHENSMSTASVWNIDLSGAVMEVTRRRDGFRNSSDERSKGVADCYSRNQQSVGCFSACHSVRRPVAKRAHEVEERLCGANVLALIGSLASGSQKRAFSPQMTERWELIVSRCPSTCGQRPRGDRSFFAYSGPLHSVAEATKQPPSLSGEARTCGPSRRSLRGCPNAGLSHRNS